MEEKHITERKIKMKRAMTLEQYSECIRKGVKAGLPYELKEAKVNIVYGENWYAQIQINRPQSNVAVHYVLTIDYREYLSGSEESMPERIIAKILNNRNLYHVPQDFCGIDVSDFKNFESRIVSRIISNKPQYIKYDRPVKYFEDMPLAMIWELHFTDLCCREDMIARMPVTTEMINKWGISVEELDRIAQKNNPLLRPAWIRNMNEILSEVGFEACSDVMNGCNIIIISNEASQDGAVVAMYPGIRETLNNMMGDEVYIIPSSIHECIAVPKSGVDLHCLYEIVREVNRTKVDEDDFLADDVLEYTQDGHLTSAIRRLEREKESQIDENHTFV